jgi:hypothetical protein
LINHRWWPSYHVNADHRYGSSSIDTKPDRHSDVCHLTNPSLAFTCAREPIRNTAELFGGIPECLKATSVSPSPLSCKTQLTKCRTQFAGVAVPRQRPRSEVSRCQKCQAHRAARSQSSGPRPLRGTPVMTKAIRSMSTSRRSWSNALAASRAF